MQGFEMTTQAGTLLLHFFGLQVIELLVQFGIHGIQRRRGEREGSVSDPVWLLQGVICAAIDTPKRTGGLTRSPFAIMNEAFLGDLMPSPSFSTDTARLIHAMQVEDEALFRQVYDQADDPYAPEVILWAAEHGPTFAVRALANPRQKGPPFSIGEHLCPSLMQVSAQAGQPTWVKAWADAVQESRRPERVTEAFTLAVAQADVATVEGLIAGGLRLQEGGSAKPLAMALQLPDLSLFHRLLAHSDDLWLTGRQVLPEAVRLGDLEILDALLPCCDPNHVAASLKAAAAAGQPEALQRLLNVCQQYRTMPLTAHLHDALIQAAQSPRPDCLPLLLTLVDARFDQSKALREAVECQNEKAIRWLLPVSDPEAAREKWKQARPGGWKHIDELARHLDPVIRDEWIQHHRQLPKSLAQARAEAGQEQAQEPTRARPRRRS
jgi:hypothetical protein